LVVSSGVVISSSSQQKATPHRLFTAVRCRRASSPPNPPQQLLHRRAQLGGQPRQRLLAAQTLQDALQRFAQDTDLWRVGGSLEHLRDQPIGQLPGLGIPPAAGLDQLEELLQADGSPLPCPLPRSWGRGGRRPGWGPILSCVEGLCLPRQRRQDAADDEGTVAVNAVGECVQVVLSGSDALAEPGRDSDPACQTAHAVSMGLNKVTGQPGQ